jgi:subtilisin family serine protease
VEYLLRLSEQLGEDGSPLPVSINISLGTNGHAHDASSATSRWLDHALATAGRSLTVAAGNAGQEAPAHPTDWGFVMGRIHTSGRLEQTGDTAELEWVVFGDSLIDISENELEIWSSPRDHLAVQVKPPRGGWLNVIEPGEYIQNRELPDGTFLSIYNEMYKPANGLNYIGVYLSPLYSREGVVGVQAGTWKVRLIGRDVRDGRYHAWIERDDPQPFDQLGERQAWFFPSFFSKNTHVDNTTVSSLACGRNVISVANLDPAVNRIHISSSQGPTRDGREKPELAAPGTRIAAARGFDPEHRWMEMTGTSMASPYAAGVAGLMLAVNPELTASQIRGIMQRTARPLTAGYSWKNDAGFGRLDPEACLYEVERLSLKEVRP